MKIMLVAFCLLNLFAPIYCSAVEPAINVCDDQAEFPPYVYYKRVNGKKNDSEISGAMIEVLDQITNLTGLRFSVTLLPWKRCLFEIEKKDRFEMYMNGIHTKERGEAALASIPIYTMSPGYWYSTKKYRQGLTIENLADLRNHKLIGLHGWSYETYGIQDEDQAQIDRGSNYQSAFRMLELNRGDILLGGYRVAYSFGTAGQRVIIDGFEWRKLNSIPPSEFHIFISKRSPRANELLSKINQAIETLNNNNVIDKIFKRYMPCGQHC